MNKKILSTPMECFFLLCAFCFSIGVLVFYLGDDFYNQHIFLFFDLALAAAYTGFLLTALPSWLGYFKDLKRVCFLFLILFLIMALSFLFNLFYARIFACLYWLILSIFALFMSIKAKNYNSLIPMLFIFCILKIIYAFTQNPAILHALIHLNTAFILIINFKISLAICNEPLEDKCHFVANVYYKNLSVFTMLLLVVASAFNINYRFLLIASAFMIFARLKDFHYLRLLKIPYIACFYTALFLLGLSYLLYAFFDEALHLILLCAIAFHIILVFNIAGLKHHGLLLKFSKSTFISIFLVIFSMILRFFEYYEIAIISLSFAFIIQFFVLFKIFNKNLFLQDA